MRPIREFLADRSAATAVEYGLLLAVLSLVIAVGVSQVGNVLVEMFSDNDRELQRAFDE